MKLPGKAEPVKITIVLASVRAVVNPVEWSLLARRDLGSGHQGWFAQRLSGPQAAYRADDLGVASQCPSRQDNVMNLLS